MNIADSYRYTLGSDDDSVGTHHPILVCQVGLYPVGAISGSNVLLSCGNRGGSQLRCSVGEALIVVQAGIRLTRVTVAKVRSPTFTAEY